MEHTNCVEGATRDRQKVLQLHRRECFIMTTMVVMIDDHTLSVLRSLSLSFAIPLIRSANDTVCSPNQFLPD